MLNGRDEGSKKVVNGYASSTRDRQARQCLVHEHDGRSVHQRASTLSIESRTLSFITQLGSDRNHSDHTTSNGVDQQRQYNTRRNT